MDIKCNTCGKDVTPLELYDGCWACPHCRSIISDFQRDFEVTKDNEELFVQSELLYARWLFNRDGKASPATIKRAVELCKRSARMGNPKALARLAFYYDKNYFEKNYTPVMRCKIAYEYYTAICFSGLQEVQVEEGLPPVRWKEMCEKTAYAMLHMLASAPPVLQESKTYNLRDNWERVRSNIDTGVSLDKFYKSDNHMSLSARAFEVLTSCLDKQRAPLFGAFQVRISDLKDLCERPMPKYETKAKYALPWLAEKKKVIMSYIRSSYIGDSSKIFTRLSTQKSFDDAFTNLEGKETVWVFFFNNNGAHKYLGSSKKRKNVQKTIFGDVGTELLKMLLMNGNQDFYAFYDDDIYQFMKHGNEMDATRSLIDKVCNGGDDI